MQCSTLDASVSMCVFVCVHVDSDTYTTSVAQSQHVESSH